MKRVTFACAFAALMMAACGGGFAAPAERLASAEAAARSARELGAEREPKASLHLRLAQEQIDQARAMIKDSQNRRADLVLQRAGADAELAVMLAKENNARADAEKAQEKVKAIRSGK